MALTARGRRRTVALLAAVVAVTLAVAVALAVDRDPATPGGAVAPVAAGEAAAEVVVPDGWLTVTGGGLAVSFPPDWRVERPWAIPPEMEEGGSLGGPCAADLVRPHLADDAPYEGPVAVVLDVGTDGTCDGADQAVPQHPALLLYTEVREPGGGPRVDLVEARRDGTEERIGSVEVLRRDTDDGVTRFVATHQTGGLWVSFPDDPIVQQILATVRPAAGAVPGAGDPGAIVRTADELGVTRTAAARQGAGADLVWHPDEVLDFLAGLEEAERPDVGPDEVVLDLHPGDTGPSHDCPRLWDLAELEIVAERLAARFAASERGPCVPNGERHLVVVPRTLVSTVSEMEVVTRWDGGLPPDVPEVVQTLAPGEFETLEVVTTDDASLPDTYAIDAEDLDAILGRAGLHSSVDELPAERFAIVVTARDLDRGTCGEVTDVIGVERRGFHVTVLLDQDAVTSRTCPDTDATGWPAYVVAVPQDVVGDTYGIRLTEEPSVSTGGPVPPPGTPIRDPDEVVLEEPDDVELVGTFTSQHGWVGRADSDLELADVWTRLEVEGEPPALPEDHVALVASPGHLSGSCQPEVAFSAVVLGGTTAVVEFLPTGSERCDQDSEEVIVLVLPAQALSGIEHVGAGVSYG